MRDDIMNDALLSSKKMDWCTPIELFNELDREFHFDLDAAATAKSAKCKHFFTPQADAALAALHRVREIVMKEEES